jgi:hypothetical protein
VEICIYDGMLTLQETSVDFTNLSSIANDTNKKGNQVVDWPLRNLRAGVGFPEWNAAYETERGDDYVQS